MLHCTFPLSESEALSVYRIFAKTEEINEIKAELNLGKYINKLLQKIESFEFSFILLCE